MSDHLPECEMNDAIPHVDDNCGTGVYCCCDRLRACEARVMQSDEPWIKASAAANAESYDEGFAAGIAAAREAVAAVCVDLNPNGKPSTTGNRWTTQKVALAAIDGLVKP